MPSAGDTRFSQDARGATAIEFALVAPLLFFALLSLVEIGVVGMLSASLDTAVVDAARRIRTGRDGAATTAEQFKAQVCARMGTPGPCTSQLSISVQTFAKFADANQVAAAGPDGRFDAGGPGDIVLVKADYRWPLMSPFLGGAFSRSGAFEVKIPARAAFKNEPYG